MGNCVCLHTAPCRFRHTHSHQNVLAEMAMTQATNLRTLIRLQQLQEAEEDARYEEDGAEETDSETETDAHESDDEDHVDREGEAAAAEEEEEEAKESKSCTNESKIVVIQQSSDADDNKQVHKNKIMESIDPKLPSPLELSLRQHLKLRHGSCRRKVDGLLDEADLSFDFAAWISSYCCSRHSQHHHHQLLQLTSSAAAPPRHRHRHRHLHLHHHLHHHHYHHHLHHQLHCHASSCCGPRPVFASSPAHLRIFAFTWNVNGKKPAMADLGRFVASLDNTRPYDLFVVGLQEVPNHDAEKLLLRSLGEGHSLVATASMSSLQLFVICRVKLEKYVHDVKIDRVGAGVYGAVTGRQKGAVAVSFKLKDAAFLFIASHLSPHEGNVEERNSEFQRISQCLFTSRPPPPRLPACLNVSADQEARRRTFDADGASNALEESDFVVWLGDLNYRIQDNRNHVDDLINQNRYMCLKHKDQLSREIEKGNVFRGFREGPLSFRPTYKYDVGTDNYDTSPKERVPSWTDRILYRVNTSRGFFFKVGMSEYDAVDYIKSSDHRPVKAVFTLSPCSPLHAFL